MTTTRVLVLVLASVVTAGAWQSTPAELSAIAAAAGIEQEVSAWCRGEFRAGYPGTFAVAVGSSGGRYLIIERNSSPIELARFTGKPSIACYSRSEVRTLADSIRRSATIHGGVASRWNTTTVCGFVDNTTSVCWQYSPDDRTFVKVGEWVT